MLEKKQELALPTFLPPTSDFPVLILSMTNVYNKLLNAALLIQNDTILYFLSA